MAARSYADFSFTDSDISFVSSGRPSVDRMYPPRLSSGSEALDRSFEMATTPMKSVDSFSTGNDFSSISQASTGTSWSSHTMVKQHESDRIFYPRVKNTNWPENVELIKVAACLDLLNWRWKFHTSLAGRCRSRDEAAEAGTQANDGDV